MHTVSPRGPRLGVSWEPYGAVLLTTQGPSWGYLKVNCSETLSTFGNKRPRNGSKNEEMAPRTRTGYPHIGLCVAYTYVLCAAVERIRHISDSRGQILVLDLM